MYGYWEYFDKGRRERPYTSASEELDDYLRLLDMMLEDYLEHKGLGREDKLFSRGLVITESELESYFAEPPYFRSKDTWSPVLAGAVGAAFDYIAERVSITNKENADLRLPIEHLKESLKLDRAGMIALILLLAVSIDRRYERIIGFLQDDVRDKSPTLGLLYALLGRITQREFGDVFIPQITDRILFTRLFLKGDQNLTLSRHMVLDPYILSLVLSYEYTSFEDKISDEQPFIIYEEERDIPFFYEGSEQKLENAFLLGPGEICCLENDEFETIEHIVFKTCERKGEKLYIFDIQRFMLFQAERRKECLASLYLRLRLENGRLCILCKEKPELRILKQIAGVCGEKSIIISYNGDSSSELMDMHIQVLKIDDPTVEKRIAIWQYFLGQANDICIAEDLEIADIADCYVLSYGEIKNTCSHILKNAKILQKNEIDRELVIDSLNQTNYLNFENLAIPVRKVYTWDDIMISTAEKELVQAACDRYRLRNRIGDRWGLKKKNAYGNGVSLLLYGPPGTGKTMVAQVIAHELSLPLYRVDVSQIFSKFIGETEKNLGTIFESASKGNVILFFDEADALFARRTEVSHSNDKYSNSETAYLLQKIEEYDGMSILATNYYSNFDEAFVRRITYIVHMGWPDADQRYELWTKILPKETEIDEDIDFSFFAQQFELSGSSIKAILYNAAYMAGADGEALSVRHIVRALKYEFKETGNQLDSSQLGPYGLYLN